MVVRKESTGREPVTLSIFVSKILRGIESGRTSVMRNQCLTPEL
jgi:hypothetical protein